LPDRLYPNVGRHGTLHGFLTFPEITTQARQRLSLLNAPAGYLDKLVAELEGITVVANASDTVDAILLFVNNLTETTQLLPGTMRLVRSKGMLWVAYPKGTSGVKTDVNRDRLWEAVEPSGWRPVRQIALDEVWSAMRFSPGKK